jgi:hypothetical protein
MATASSGSRSQDDRWRLVNHWRWRRCNRGTGNGGVHSGATGPTARDGRCSPPCGRSCSRREVESAGESTLAQELFAEFLDPEAAGLASSQMIPHPGEIHTVQPMIQHNAG